MNKTQAKLKDHTSAVFSVLNTNLKKTPIFIYVLNCALFRQSYNNHVNNLLEITKNFQLRSKSQITFYD